MERKTAEQFPHILLVSYSPQKDGERNCGAEQETLLRAAFASPCLPSGAVRNVG